MIYVRPRISRRSAQPPRFTDRREHHINLAAQTKHEGYLGSTAAFVGSSVHEHAQTRIIILRSIRTVIGQIRVYRDLPVGPGGRLKWLAEGRTASS